MKETSSPFIKPIQTRYHARKIFGAAHLSMLVRPHLLNGNHVPHDHDFWEAVLIFGGSGRHLSARGEQRLGAGDTFLLRPGIWHTYADCQDLEVYNCCFRVSLLKRELASFFQEPVINHLLIAGPQAARSRGMMALHLSPDDQAHCRTLLDSMQACGREDSPFSHREQLALLVLFLSRLARIAASSEMSPQAPGTPEPIHAAADQMMRLMDERLEHPWGIRELADTVHLEGAYCIRVFRKATGLSPIAYLSRSRAERAASLLLRTELPISEIAQQIGWSDPNYFARRFRAHFGINATEYRARFSSAAHRAADSAAVKISDAPRPMRSS